MSEYHFIAVMTYGKEKHGDNSYFKLGRGAGADVLLALFDGRVRELAAPRASYRYVYVADPNATTHRNFLVLRLTPDEKAQVETICRKVGSHPWVYIWESEGRRWLEFPCAPQAHYIDPSSYGGSCPKFPPTAARFVTPSKSSAETTEVKSTGGLTLTQSGDWWWIAGDTYPHRETLRNVGAKWSKTRREWYYTSRDLPQAIRDLAAASEPIPPSPVEMPTPESESSESISSTQSTVANSAGLVTTETTPLHIPPDTEALEEPEVALPESVQVFPEALMRSVRTDDVTAALVAHIHDSERNKPILVDFIGSRNAVKQLLSKPFNPAYIGARAESAAFTITDGSRYTGFRLPDTSYKALNSALGGRVVEGRIVSLEATVSAPREACYVLVMNRIELPTAEHDQAITDMWLRYVRYRQTPNHPEFSRYMPPEWASDLYKVYQALRARIGRPLHERWMPWLFAQVADKPLSSERLDLDNVILCKYIAGYVDPKTHGVVECGAYRLTCRDMSDLWAEVLIRNPNRAEGILFSQQP